MIEIQFNMAAVAGYYTKFLCLVTPKFYDFNPCVCCRPTLVKGDIAVDFSVRPAVRPSERPDVRTSGRPSVPF